MDLKVGAVASGKPSGRPDATISMAEPDFLALFNGALTPMKAFLVSDAFGGCSVSQLCASRLEFCCKIASWPAETVPGLV
eukprot:SAG31_NODE_760_length_12279_cov_2.439655_8_plen_80_part_00